MRNNLNELISRVNVWRATRRSTRGEQPVDGVEMDEKNDQIAHRRIVAGREILRNHERNSVPQRQLRMQSTLYRSFKIVSTLTLNCRGWWPQVVALRHFLYL